MADWHIGQEIVCVDTNWVHGFVRIAPMKGSIYTIEHILSDGDPNGIAFHLNEIQSVNAWYSFHFRPVKKTKTDISTFTSLLTPASKSKPKQRVLEDA